MRISSNSANSIRDFFRSELNGIYTRDESDLLFSFCWEVFCGSDSGHGFMDDTLKVTESQLLKFSSAVKELKKHRPIQYVLQDAPFYQLRFFVDESVLIPRPETEELVHLILKDLRDAGPVRILDVGTGSGCIAVSLKKNLPNAEIMASDVSDPALEIAAQNAKNNQVDVLFLKDSVLDSQLPHPLQLDVIVSNPPYITEAEKVAMEKNVLEFEPSLALFVTNQDPLQFYKAILNFADKHLVAGGYLYLETSSTYAVETQQLLVKSGYKNVSLFKDINDKNRILRGRK